VKLYKTDYYGRSRDKQPSYTITEAIDSVCQSSGERGVVEDARDTAANVAFKPGELVSLLHANGCLKDSDVIALTGFEKGDD